MLTINNVETSDSETYQIVTGNPVGKDNKKCEMVVSIIP